MHPPLYTPMLAGFRECRRKAHADYCCLLFAIFNLNCESKSLFRLSHELVTDPW